MFGGIDAILKKTKKSNVEQNSADAEQSISPEKREQLEKLFERALANGRSFLYKDQTDFDHFFKVWLQGRPPLTIEKMIDFRKLWLEMRKEGPQFQKVIEDKMRQQLREKDAHSIFFTTKIYESMGFKNPTPFLGELINREEVWGYVDRSAFYNACKLVGRIKDPRSIADLTKLISTIVASLADPVPPPYGSSNIMVAAQTLQVVSGGNAMPIIHELAETDPTFKGWFEKRKLEQFTDEKLNVYVNNESYFSDPHDEKLEAERLQLLETELKKAQQEWTADTASVASPSEHDTTSDLLDDDDEPYQPDESEDRTPSTHEGAYALEKKKAVNFYGRFNSGIEKEKIRALTRENYLASLQAFAKGNLSEKEYFHFLGGQTTEEWARASDDVPSSEEALRMLTVGCARAHYCARVEGMYEDAREELDLLKNYFSSGEISGKEKESPQLRASFADRIMALRSELTTYEQAIHPSLPKSAESFLMYHSGYDRAREIPAYRTLLAEKIRWRLALCLGDELKDIGVRSVSDPSFQLSRDIADEYENNVDLYQSVEKNDIPLYWEASEKLADYDVDRAVVFGRDGRYLFTALKANDFGIGKRDLKYLVVTRNMQDELHGTTKSEITEYLKQHGATLDFNYVDTGYAGSIPHFAITCLADDAGVTLSEDEIDNRIKLLSSTYKDRRKELSRRHGSEDTKVGTIEHRPQRIKSPSKFELENGKLEPVEVPTSISEQLRAWTVEHVSLRNFAPRLDGDKRVHFIQVNPIEGWIYKEDIRGNTIGTHPLELWEGPDGEKALLKGGPEHTLRSEFIGSKFFRILGENAPTGELIQTDKGLRFKMEYLQNYSGGGIDLPEKYKNSEQIQKGFLVDMLVGQYDRTPWNIMFPKDETKEDVVFIDHGGCLTSRARGGYKGFPEHFTVEELAELLTNPQFLGKPVNEAYANLVEVRNGNVIVKNHDRMWHMLGSFSSIGNAIIDEIVEQAGYADGRRSVEALRGRVRELGNKLEHIAPSSPDYKKTKAAVETCNRAIEIGGEATYLKHALTQRKSDIQKLFEQILTTRDTAV